LGGRGFVLSRDEMNSLVARNRECATLIHPLRHGKDITDIPRDVYVIDTFGWDEAGLRTRVPEIYQRLRDTVFSQRQVNRDERLRRQWWLFRGSNAQVRSALTTIPRYIATPETARHRIFQFLETSVCAEHKLVTIGSADAFGEEKHCHG
jgi:hypothetical protein